MNFNLHRIIGSLKALVVVGLIVVGMLLEHSWKFGIDTAGSTSSGTPPTTALASVQQPTTTVAPAGSPKP